MKIGLNIHHCFCLQDNLYMFLLIRLFGKKGQHFRQQTDDDDDDDDEEDNQNKKVLSFLS